MEKGAQVVVLAITAILILLAGNADAAEDWSEEQVLKMYAGSVSKIVLGPGTATNNMSEAGFGTLSIYDVEVRAGSDNTSKYYGQCRGWFLVDSMDATKTITLFTVDFNNDMFNGSVIFSGTQDLTIFTNTVPMIGGAGHFSSVKGYAVLTPVLPDKATPVQQLLAVFIMELHYRLPKVGSAKGA